MKTGIELISQERVEQVEKHKFDLAHDAQHGNGEMAAIAATLCCLGVQLPVTVEDMNFDWGTGDDPWGLETKLKGDRIHQLKVAGALIAAEIDRLIRIKNYPG